jgi:hypothetical protein
MKKLSIGSIVIMALVCLCIYSIYFAYKNDSNLTIQENKSSITKAAHQTLKTQYTTEFNSESSLRKASAEQGKNLLLKILNKYPKLNQGHEKPFLLGGVTNIPVIVIAIPLTEWNTISEKERKLLCDYVSSLVPQVRLSPFMFTDIPENAPIASKFRQNTLKMTNESWGIMGGDVIKDGKFISYDHYVKTGF